MVYTIDELRRIIAPIAIEHGVERVSLFGSYSKGLATEESDVDLIIAKGKIKTLFQLTGFRLDVEDALALPVDVITDTSSDKSFLDKIGKDELMLYQNT